VDRPEHGWVLIIRAFSGPDAQVRETQLREAIAVGRRFGDPDIEFLVIRLANLRVRQGRPEEAGQLLEGLGQHPDAVPVLAGCSWPGDAAVPGPPPDHS
jgi:hypothetical protein